jgi:hypothetical protein
MSAARRRQPGLAGLVVPDAPKERERQRILREASVVRGSPETRIRDTQAAARARLAAFDRGTGSLTQLAAGRLFVAYGEGALEVLRLAHEAGLLPGVNYAEAVFWLETGGVTGQQVAPGTTTEVGHG